MMLPDEIRSGRPAREEGELLLTALRANEPACAAAVERFGDDEWDLVLRHGEWHNVLSLLSARLHAARVTVPAETAERLRRAYMTAAARNLRIKRQLDEIFAACAAERVAVMPLKGAALVDDVYQNLALRPMRDIDLLVRVEELGGFERIMFALGYGPRDRPSAAAEREIFHHLTPYRREGGVRIEVHWTLELPTSPFDIDLEALWQRARRMTVAGHETLVLSPEDMLLHLSLHASYHHHFRVRLRHLMDVALAIDAYEGRMSWDLLAARAREWRAERFVYSTLGLAAQLLGARVPPSFSSALGHGPEDDRLIEIAGDFVLAAPLQLPIAYREAHGREGMSAKTLVYLGTLFPRPAKLRAMYHIPRGSWTLPLYYFVRPVDVALRLGRILARIGKHRGRLPLTLEREDNGLWIDWWVTGNRAGGAGSAAPPN
jgi:hypothetical protein